MGLRLLVWVRVLGSDDSGQWRDVKRLEAFGLDRVASVSFRDDITLFYHLWRLARSSSWARAVPKGRSKWEARLDETSL